MNQRQPNNANITYIKKKMTILIKPTFLPPLVSFQTRVLIMQEIISTKKKLIYFVIRN